MLKYVSLIIVFIVFISETRSDNETRFESFCNSKQPIECDDSLEGSGGFTYRGSQGRDSWLVILNKNEIHGIDIVLSSFKLQNSFLVIREASTAGVLSTGKIQFISGETSKKLKFFIPFSKSFYMEICPEKGKDDGGEFTIYYERSVTYFGEDPLPTEHPTIEMEKQAVEIQFKGKTMAEFKNEIFILMFKEAVKSIARDYCLKAEIPFEETKSADEMVTIHAIRRCPREWTDTEICTSVHHSVFVSGGDSVDRKIWEYQLTRNNLQDMWMLADNKYLKLIGLSIYETSDRLYSIGWLLLSCFFPYIFLIGFVCLLRVIYRYIVEDMQGSFSIPNETADVENRQKMLMPNKFQQVPLFIKEETLNVSGSEDDGGTQGKERSYRAALFLSRFKLNESIAE